MSSDELLRSIRRWLMVIALLFAVLLYLVSAASHGVYLDNVIVLLSGGIALTILFYLGDDIVPEYAEKTRRYLKQIPREESE